MKKMMRSISWYTFSPSVIVRGCCHFFKQFFIGRAIPSHIPQPTLPIYWIQTRLPLSLSRIDCSFSGGYGCSPLPVSSSKQAASVRMQADAVGVITQNGTVVYCCKPGDWCIVPYSQCQTGMDLNPPGEKRHSWPKIEQKPLITIQICWLFFIEPNSVPAVFSLGNILQN